MLNKHATSKVGKNRKSKAGLTAVLDLGTNKVACLIAKSNNTVGADGDNGPRIVGFGHQMSHGLRSGTIIDIEQAEMIIRSTVEAAEKEAGANIDKVIVNLGAPDLDSKLIAYEVDISGKTVSELDMRRAFQSNIINKDGLPDRELVHTIPVGYSIDGAFGIRDPRGMYGERMGINMHTISAKTGPIKNLETVISNCHLGIDKIVVSPFASALACLVEDEKQVGVTCLDMGAGTTSAAIFFDGELVYTDTIPIGGQNITSDIARGIATSMVHAERMKNCFGNAIPSINDDHELIRVPIIGDQDDPDDTQIARSMLIGIIRPRLEETIEMVRGRIEKAGFGKVAGRHAVICGGASQLPGLPELVGKMLNKQVRAGRPRYISGLPEFAKGPEFSTCVGLLYYTFENRNELSDEVSRMTSNPEGKFGRFGQWFRENF